MVNLRAFLKVNIPMLLLRTSLKESALIEKSYSQSLKVSCTLLKVPILSPFKGDDDSLKSANTLNI